ncbi:Elongation factor Tu [Trichostrongylus colubriformis]|uniref:Elongation factor Tu n=1 Tax=Trichostrongylus colubriformis TaxID=6319 RepID=A0AAN8IF18_TRICO
MATRFRVRQLIVATTVVVSLILIYKSYSVNDTGKGAVHNPQEIAPKAVFHEKEFDFKIVVSGQDSDRRDGPRDGKSSGNAAHNLQDQKCQIPKLEINGSEVKSFFFKPKPLECDKNPTNWVYIDDKSQVQYIEQRKNAKCRGYYVARKDDNSNHMNPFTSLPAGKPLTSDFAIVKCKDGKEKWSGILMSVVRRDDSQLLRKKVETADSSGLNIFFLGFDSLSHMSFRRKMSKTVEVLEKSLGSVVLNGYNIVGDGTPQAFIPILTSSTEEELPLTRKRFPNANYVDDVYPFIWNNFSSAGYVTLYGEDAFAIGTFTYRLKGFRKQPTDHYTRPIFKEHEKTGGNCLGSEPLHKSWFRYAREFMRVYSDMPRFLLMHQSLLSHDDINLVEVEDDDVAETLTSMHKSGELDNSMVIVMADHGHRFAKLRETHQGQLEERLPFFSIALPAAFKNTEHGKKMYENLEKNKDRLTTPFDIHATLMDVLHLPEDLTTVQDTTNRSLSLFRPIPEDRTCAQAGVEPHWCTCLNWQNALSAPEDQAVANQLALAIVDVINRQLKDVFHLCAVLSLDELLEARKLVPNEGVLKYKNVKDMDGFVPDLSGSTGTAFAHYQIKLRTRPGSAIYEVTLFYDFKLKEVHIDLGAISHPNKFGDAPHCIINQNYFLATYLDVYPTKEEIISNASDLQCEHCGKSFSNASARRLHTVKTHGVLSCDGDKRIYERISDGLARTYIYHCPAEGCRKRDLRFEGKRNLKQHYLRVHTEKSFKCKCGSLFALQKDMLYHQKKRCLLRDLRKNPAKRKLRFLAIPVTY